MEVRRATRSWDFRINERMIEKSGLGAEWPTIVSGFPWRRAWAELGLYGSGVSWIISSNFGESDREVHN